MSVQLGVACGVASEAALGAKSGGYKIVQIATAREDRVHLHCASDR